MVLKGYFETLSKKYHEKKRKRFLKKNGCESEEEYARRFDPDVIYRATQITNWYEGYPYVRTFEDPLGDIWTKYGDWLQALDEMDNWCKENIKHKYRYDVHRVIKTEYNGYCLNDIGGLDYVFFAFKDEKDFMWFALRWGGS
jgi:hypothetical protein